MKRSFLLLSLISVLGSCKKSETGGNNLQSIYREYKAGAISECMLDGRKVYCAGLNAYDAGMVIYDTTGKVIATCNYAWGKPDPECARLSSCEMIYCCDDHISGWPATDKYDLGR